MISKKIIFFGIIILILGCQKLNYDSFAKCLSEKGMVMYGAYWCDHCKEQKKIFGSSFQYINYVECTEKQQTCDDAGIKGYPTWVIEGKSYEGVQLLYNLSSLTECKIGPV